MYTGPGRKFRARAGTHPLKRGPRLRITCSDVRSRQIRLHQGPVAARLPTLWFPRVFHLTAGFQLDLLCHLEATPPPRLQPPQPCLSRTVRLGATRKWRVAARTRTHPADTQPIEKFPSSAAFDAIAEALNASDADRKDAVKQGNAVFAFTLKNKAGETQSWHIDLKETGKVGTGTGSKPTGEPPLPLHTCLLAS